MYSFLAFIALNTVSVYLVAQVLPGFSVTGGTFGYVMVGVVVGLLNVFLKPILKILSLPFLFLTIGLFTLVVNGAILWIAERVVEFLHVNAITFTIDGAFTYLLAVLLFGVINYIFHKLIR